MKKWLIISAICTVIITGLFLVWKNLNKEAVLPIAPQAASVPSSILPPAKPVVVQKTAPKGESKISLIIKAQAQKMNQLSANAAQDEEELNALAASLSSDEGKELAKLALDSSHNKNERFLSVYVLSKRAQDFIPELAAIAASKNPILGSQPAPHTAALIAKNSEVSISIEALKGLDTVVNGQGQDLAPIFQNVQNESPSITVRQLARIGYVGAVRGEPLVRKYIDSKLQAVLR